MSSVHELQKCDECVYKTVNSSLYTADSATSSVHYLYKNSYISRQIDMSQVTLSFELTC